MVSFQEQLKFEIIAQKKRRWEDSNIQEVGAEKEFFKKISKVDTNNQKPSTKSLFFDEYINFFRLEKPSDDRKNQSEKLQHYNTKDNLEKIVSTTACNKDPTKKPSLSSDRLEIGLDLELNLLPYESLKTTTTTATTTTSDHKCSEKNNASRNDDNDAVKVNKRRPSWMSFNDDEGGEMVAAACMRCHMLVMLSKSSPCCPNCKFMHPTDQKSPIDLFKPRFSLKG